jgi:hypothetical protein
MTLYTRPGMSIAQLGEAYGVQRGARRFHDNPRVGDDR